MYYFAYGSTLDLLQMRLRCPKSRFLTTARLDGYRICFPRKSVVRDCATISVEPADGECVWGVLFEVGPDDMERLDDREGFQKRRDPSKNAHNRITVKVETAEGKAAVAEAYVAVPTENPGLPSSHYIAFLVSCAAECGLPKSHLVALAAHLPLGQSQAA
jgi:cation transport regulator ChaC